MAHVWRCMYCQKTSTMLFHYPASEEQSRDPDRVWLAWPEPSPRELPGEAPASVRALYQEASVCERVLALRGAAGLYRASVEELVRDQGLTEGTLKVRINGLAAKGVDSDIIRDLHEARLTANWSLHEGIEFAPEEVADVAELIADAVEVLYVLPARREAMRAARERRRQGEQDERPEPRSAGIRRAPSREPPLPPPGDRSY